VPVTTNSMPSATYDRCYHKIDLMFVAVIIAMGTKAPTASSFVVTGCFIRMIAC